MVAHWPDTTRSCQSDGVGTKPAPSGVIGSCFHTPEAGLGSLDRDHMAAGCIYCLTLSRNACRLAQEHTVHRSAACSFSSAPAPILLTTFLTANGPGYSEGRTPHIFLCHFLFAGRRLCFPHPAARQSFGEWII